MFWERRRFFFCTDKIFSTGSLNDWVFKLVGGITWLIGEIDGIVVKLIWFIRYLVSPLLTQMFEEFLGKW
jgi:hypothetical protein